MTDGAITLQHTPTGARRLAALDGYRGLFVSLVILYHLGVTSLVGGWVGINHFFVFSGYLIARLLISERARTGRIDVLAFYRRRMRRILPGMVALVTVVVAHTWWTAAAADKRTIGGDALATLGFAQNWRLIARGDEYFEQIGNPSPLRHAWTLGVEEQFYALVPLLVLGVWLVTRRRRGRVAIIAALAALSAAWTARLATHGASFPRLYYGTDTRAQALLVGVMFAFWWGRDDRGRLGPRPSAATTEVLGWIGLAISVLAFFVVDARSSWLFTRGGMLVFALGAGLMGLTATDTRPMRINRIASWGPLPLLGQMTFGLYLYHWPIHLWLAPHLTALPLWASIALQAALVVAVAYASFRWLEVPVMYGGLRSLVRFGRHPGVIPGLVTAVVAVAAVALWRTPVRATDLDVPPLLAGQAAYVPDAVPHRVMLVGDSVGSSLMAGWRPEVYRDILLDNGTRIGCDLIDAPSVAGDQQASPESFCATWRKTWPATARQHGDTDVVVLAGAQFVADHEVGGRTVRAGTQEAAALIGRSLDDIAASAKAAGAPHLQVVTLPCRRIEADKLDPSLRSFAGPGSDDHLVAWANAAIGAWASTHSAQVIDLWKPLCGNGFRATINGIPLYHDSVHFSPAGAAMVWTWLAPQVQADAR